MKASFLIRPGKIELLKTKIPKASEGEILVKIKAALTCGTDLKAFSRGHHVIPMPGVFGHEFSGIVADVGKGVRKFKRGDEIMAVHSAPCLKCRYCKKGLCNLCEKIMDTKVLGAFAEYILLPSHIVKQNVFHKPSNLTFKEAAFLEPLSCVVHGMQELKIKERDKALIIGAGPIGLLHLLLLKNKGADVIITGLEKKRLALAKKLGASVAVTPDKLANAINKFTAGLGVDYVFECTGQPDIWQSSVNYVRRGGTVILFGGCKSGTTVTYDTGRLHYDELTLKGVFHFTPDDVRLAYSLLKGRKIKVSKLITGEYQLKDTEKAFLKLTKGEGIKYAIIPYPCHSKMKVAKLYSFTDIRIEDIPVPEIGARDALLKTKACGICSGDVMPWYIGKKAPVVLGHEPAGEIAEVGKEVSYFKPGDRVFTHHHAPCFTCRVCRRGDYVQCETWKNTRIIPGGVSEYILIPQTNLENDTLNLPDKLSYEDGALIEPVACVVKALKRANVRRGDTVLVIGLGIMGQLNILLARKYGAGKIIGADMVPFRLEKAKESGADEVIDVSKSNLIETLKDLTSGEMADIVIVGPNSIAAMKQGIESAGRGGKVLFFTPAKPDEQLTINPNELYFKDINIITSYSCGPTDTADALELIEQGAVKAENIVTHRFPIEKTAEAFRLTAEAKDSLKSVIVFE